MNIKTMIVAAVLGFLVIIGFNYYKSERFKQSMSVRDAETEILRQEIKKSEIEKARNIQIQLDQDDLKSMPLAAQEIIAAREAELKPDTEYQNLETEKEDRAKLDDIMGRWYDVSAVASRTSRISLAPVVQNMQALKREADKLIVTPCLTRVQANMLVSMESLITMYLRFMSDSKADITGDMMNNLKAQEQYYLLVEKCTN